jgi:hypothetical protein
MAKLTGSNAVRAIALGVIAAASTLYGCKSSAHDQAHTAMIVQTTTQPSNGDASSDAARRVEVTVRDSLSGGATHTLVGRTCRVQFRRDALGMATPAPLPAGADSSGGRPVTMTGTIVMSADGWVVLESAGRATWIPQSAILTVEVRD